MSESAELLHYLVSRLGWGSGRVKLRSRLSRDQARALASMADTRVVYGTRRAGKTELFGAMCHEYGLPGETGVFAAPTVSKAIDLIGAKLHELRRTLGLGFEMHKGVYIVQSGARVQCRGLDSMPDVELLRGDRPPFAIIDECFVAGTEIRTVGAIHEVRSKPAPSVLVSVDGITSTPNHPYLTPRGWQRADELRVGDMLCVWDDFSAPEAWAEAQDVFRGVLDGIEAESNGRECSEAAASCHRGHLVRGVRGAEGLEEPQADDLRSGGVQAGDVPPQERGVRGAPQCGVQPFGQGAPAGAGPQAEDARWERPWAYRAGAPDCGSHRSQVGRDRGTRGRRAPLPLQVGPRVRIDEAVRGAGWGESPGGGSKGPGRAQGRAARWRRVGHVEVHERGGVGRYAEVCPDGRVYNLTTESGLYFAGGRLVHNCGAVKEDRLKYAIQEALRPSLADWWQRGGRGLVLGGTPTRHPRSWWARVCLGEVYPKAEVFKLDLLDNPLFADGRGEAFLAKEREENGWTEDSPEYLRELRGMFCGDNSGLVFSGFSGEILPDKMAPTERDADLTVLGVDFGLRDANAWVVIRVLGNDIHAVVAKKENNLNHADIAARTRVVQDDWRPRWTAGDTFGRGSQDVKTLVEAFGCNIEGVKYSTLEKAPRLDFANTICQTGRFFVYESARPLAEEMMVLPWDEERKHPLRGYSDHAVDAYLVALDRVRQDRTIEPQQSDEERALKARFARAQELARAASPRRKV